MKKNNLIKIRKEKKFTQQDLAECLKISQTQYLRKEKGDVCISDQEWEKIANLFNVEIDIIRQDDIEGNQNDFNNNYYSVPAYLLEIQHEYVLSLKKKIAHLKKKIKELKR